ncbi:Putative oxygen oxidoreductase covalent FAD-binding, FAD-binding domain, PCMH-type [Colletotrichum destructivum]|uniref:Oxygen oxidoreductase covalent FAD-binding, FAD-binding domain, PCMH-type n=1 Tax=Colletotrichum destructivum TaxID=34406 RepID=A0AAX4HZR4_9PEZI|nr:Putative oxygen oxidoreductase covalent FAD-binding, FAD-binding domain, PCMH-type [Colletotrichum destructivum]
MARIQDFQGMQYSRTGDELEQQDYAFFNQQYATSTYQKDHDMNPDLIVRPKHDEDVIRAVNWARENKVAVAVKSGGHQYSGASSTGGKNIQVDLSNTYKDLMVLRPKEPIADDRALVYIGVSTTMMDLNKYLKHNKLFVPTGQCAYVGVGGHGQTGGYGQLGRSFGLFGDHIRTIRLVCHDGVIRDITKLNDPELFYALLGGSPGNFGIITHYIVEVYKSKSYVGTVAGPNGFKGPHGIKALWIYSKEVLTRLLTTIAEMADDPTFPRGFDLCVSVISTEFPMATLFKELNDASVWDRVQDKIRNALEDKFLKLLNGKFPASIILYAQWCPTSKGDKYDARVDAWFNKFRELKGLLENESLQFGEFDMEMSDMTGQWLFPRAREFDLPYVKRTYATKSTTLGRDNWVSAVVDRIDLIYNPEQYLRGHAGEKAFERFMRCKLSVQIQCFGGAESRFFANRGNGTSYSWRDSSVVQTLDCFHNPDEESRRYALEWQNKNDAVMIGPRSPFSKQDRRVLWGSYGDWNLGDESVWKTYYEDEEKYNRLGRVRARADPNGTFTANPFAVTAAGSKK